MSCFPCSQTNASAITAHILSGDIALQPPIPARHGQCATVIDESTRHVQQHVQQLLQGLHARAKALAACAQFDACLRDAAFMRALAPSSALGYLCAAHAYGQQGHQQAAIDILGKGLKEVPPSEPEYSRLLSTKDAAQQAASKRIDMITRLPLDVVMTNIVPRIVEAGSALNQAQPWPYLDVSRGWRERMLRWNRLRLRINYDVNYIQVLRQLRKFAGHVESLVLDQHRNELLSRVVKCGKFAALKKLVVQESTMRQTAMLFRAVRAVSSTLTHLEIRYKERYPRVPIAIDTVLNRCPNLTCLKMMKAEVSSRSYFASSGYPKITHLELTNIQRFDTMSSTVIEDTLQYFPRLLTLRIHPCRSTRLLQRIYQHCPVLERLYCNFTGHISDSSQRPPDSSGLRQAHISIPGMTDKDLIIFITQHCDTLEILTLNGSIHRELSGDPFPQHVPETHVFRLHTLRLETGGSGNVQFFEWIAQRAPYLATMELPHGCLTDGILNAMTSLTCLRKTQLTESISPENQAATRQFLDHHVSLGDQSTLQELELRDYAGTSFSSMFEPVSLLRQLHTLTILVKPSAHPPSSTFISAIANGCPALEELTLAYDRSNISSDAFMKLGSHPRLKRLTIKMPQLSDQTLLSTMYFPSLEHLDLALNSHVETYILHLLRTKITKVTYIHT